jgi:molybdenum cofactor biosynthesis enzyme MoaA
MAGAIEISSLSVMVGSPACNLRCPFCISKQTYRVETPSRCAVPLARIAFLADKFLRVCAGLPYGIITGKGEPTLVSTEALGDVIEVLYAGGKGLIPELQTNGTLLDQDNLARWRAKGLNTVALSCVSHRDEVNSRILSDGTVQWKLDRVVHIARDLGLLVRVTLVTVKGGVDSKAELGAFLDWAERSGVHQLTFRRAGSPRQLGRPGSEAVGAWIEDNRVDPDFVLETLRERGQEQDPFPWARCFTYRGMSVVVTDCMNPPKERVVRHAVIQPDGHLYGSWDDPGHILI